MGTKWQPQNKWFKKKCKKSEPETEEGGDSASDWSIAHPFRCTQVKSEPVNILADDWHRWKNSELTLYKFILCGF